MVLILRMLLMYVCMYVCMRHTESTLSGLQLPSGCAQFPSVESVVAALSEVAAIQAHNFKMVAELIVWQVGDTLSVQ